MKRIFMALLTLLLLSAPIYAQDAEYDELLDQSGIEEIYSLIPPEARMLLRENGIEGADSDAILNLSLEDMVKTITATVKKTVKMPLTVFLSTVGVILLCALFNSMGTTFKSLTNERLFSAVSVICVSAVVIAPISTIILALADLIKDISAFLLSFIPIYVGIITSSGKPLTAAAYSTATVTAAEFISSISATTLVPLLSIYLAFCLVGSVSEHIYIGAIAKSVKNVVVTVLSFALAIFTGILALKGVVATSADGLAMKGVKFAAGAFLPVVGTAVSEALETVNGCMGLIKSTVGVFGILVICAIFLPPLITNLLLQMSLSLSHGISECMDTQSISRLLFCAKNVLSLINGILIVLVMLVIIVVGMLLSMGG